MSLSAVVLSFLLVAATLAQAASVPASPGKLRYNRDVRPILSDFCFHCHGPDKSHREADLRLDVREAAIEAGAISPGKPETSSLIERIQSHDEHEVMPPPESKKTLSEAQKQTLIAWVRQGANYEPHWAYTPLVRPEPQDVPAKHPIDAFILSSLKEKGMALSAPADRRTLIRRMSLDLVGLPPTPAEVERFVQSSESAENLAKRLMSSPHFGERWAVWWLDVARFADTVGFHGDQNQRIYPYRDYVIAAFNSNKRFDQFTLEQLAGDLLPNATQEQLIASGFNRLNMMTREGGAQAREYLMKYQADRVRTIGGAWMGATLGCAECHDHKFDPFTQRDFYSLSAYFADIKQFGVYSSYRKGESEELKGFSNDHPFPPEILVDSPYLQKRMARLAGEMARSAEAVLAQPEMRKAYETWRKAAIEAKRKNPAFPWLNVQAEVTSKSANPPPARPKDAKPTPTAALPPAVFRVEPDQRVVFGPKGSQSTAWTFQPGSGRVAAVKIELLPEPEHQNSLFRGGEPAAMTLKPSFEVWKAGVTQGATLAVLHAEANLKEPVYSGGVEKVGIASGWKIRAADAGKAHTSVWLIEKPPHLSAGDRVVVRLSGHSAGSVRVTLGSHAALAPLAEFQPSPEAWLAQEAHHLPAYPDWRKRYEDYLDCRGGKAWTQVTVALKEPMTIRVLARGNWMDESGEVQLPSPPEFLTSKPAESSRRQSRVDLAKWLTSKENPLTARAFMNRLWKQFFGNGLSSVIDDLGAQGETPSHPELLDWLACEFRDSGWDVQHMMRLIVTSQTYMQDSKARPQWRDLDPANRLLSYQNPRRLDAEFIRDNALFAAGILNLQDVGGPSVKPYQPANYYENLQFPSRDYLADSDDRQWRRGVYMHWQRTFLHPMLANFDAPPRDECACSRNVSNTPQQALTLLNDPTFVEAARSLAASLPRQGSDEDRLNDVFVRTLSRVPKDKEKKGLLAFLNAQRAAFEQAPEEAAKLVAVGLQPSTQLPAQDLAAWTSLCRVVLNLHETMTRY